MIESIKDVMTASGAAWVLWILIGLSVICLAITLDRIRYFRLRRDDTARLMVDLHAALERSEPRSALALLERSSGVAATVATAGLLRWQHGPGAVKAALAAAGFHERAKLERRLGFLGTVGNNAPFVGLLGTVIGVVGAFDAMGRGGSTSTLAPELVMGNIAEALVATAVGLVVAIPAVAMFNYFQGAITRMIEAGETLGHLLVSYVEGNDHVPTLAAEPAIGRSSDGRGGITASAKGA
jgi:biopolymer transport protein ExbB